MVRHPHRTLRLWGIILVLLAAAAYLVYTIESRARLSPEDRAKKEIASATELVHRASVTGGTVRPGSHLAQARDSLRGAEESFTRANYDAAFRLAVESQASARRALGGSGKDDAGDGSLISVEGDVAVQTARGLVLRTGAAAQSLSTATSSRQGAPAPREIMFSDGTLYTIRPASLFEVRRPASAEAGGSQIKMVSGAVNVYTAASSSTVSSDAATTSIDRESRVAVDVEKGEKTDVTTYRGKATVSNGQETVVLAERERITAGAKSRQLSAKVVVPDTPGLVLPTDNRVYDLKTSDEIELKWSPVTRASRYRIQVSRSRLFAPDATDVDLDNRTGTGARVKVTREGSYFWRVAAIDTSGRPSDWSAVRRFKMGVEPAPGLRGSPPRPVSPPADGEPLPDLRQDGPGRRRNDQRRAGRRRAGRLVQENRHRQPGGVRDPHRQGRRRRRQ